jgi:hypothetical protein
MADRNMARRVSFLIGLNGKIVHVPGSRERLLAVGYWPAATSTASKACTIDVDHWQRTCNLRLSKRAIVASRLMSSLTQAKTGVSAATF